MNTIDFYKIIDSELLSVIEENKEDTMLMKHKNVSYNKGAAMLVWFLRFYGQKTIFSSYITDGKDDNSCDIIFSNTDTEGETIYYVVQSKYVNVPSEKTLESYPRISKKEFGYTVNEFSKVLNGNIPEGDNISFSANYAKLKNHLEKNGKVRCLFFTLALSGQEVGHSISDFNQRFAPNVSLDIIDIEKIKKDIIEYRFKEIISSNPLESDFSPESIKIQLPIERNSELSRDVFQYKGRAKAFVVLLKPSTVHGLFGKFRFNLFFRNVRNPIHSSNYNEKIVETLLKKPDSFWYFNNGVTSITRILPEIGLHAQEIEIDGLQIINGAQTVYSVYSAYESATPSERRAMDEYARISLRVIGSSDEEFNLQITRFTNMQNPMEARDFWANDSVQLRLQNESFDTDIWYEKRRGEFRLSSSEVETLGISVVSNADFALTYTCFILQRPSYITVNHKNVFVSRWESPEGIYEEVFNEKTTFRDMYVSLWVARRIDMISGKISKSEEVLLHFMRIQYLLLAFSYLMFKRYFSVVVPFDGKKEFNLLLNLYGAISENDKQKLDVIDQLLVYSLSILLSFLAADSTDSAELNYHTLMNNANSYERLAERFSKIEIDIDYIKNIDPENISGAIF